MFHSKKDEVPTEIELLEIAKWHIARCDGLRHALSSRAAVILSADALIAGAIAVLLSRANEIPSPRGSGSSLVITAQTVLLVSVAATFISVLYAMRSLDNKYAWRMSSSSRRSPDSPAFNHGDTLRMYKSFAEFRRSQLSLTFPTMLEHAQVELWFVIRSHGYRYAQLRRSTRYLSISALAVLTDIFVILMANVINRL
jgi:hypothetical protein